MFQKKNMRIINTVKNSGEEIGYQCLGPLTSCLLEEKVKPQHLKFALDPKCDSITLDNTINTPKIENDKARQALGALFVEARLSGACRFWNENGYKASPECENVHKTYLDTEKVCLDTLNQHNY